MFTILPVLGTVVELAEENKPYDCIAPVPVTPVILNVILNGVFSIGFVEYIKLVPPLFSL